MPASMPPRRLIGGLVGSAVLLVVVTTALWPDPPGGGPVTGDIARVLARADPVPRGPIVTSVPSGCGVSAYTRDRLALRGAADRGLGSAGDHRSCSWETGAIASSLGGGNRELTVTVTTHGSIVNALDRFSLEAGQGPATASQSRPGPVKTLSGLGEEALVRYQVDSTAPIYPGGRQEKGFPLTSHATILFRQGNVVARVEYGGADYEAGRLYDRSRRQWVLPEASALDGALMAARDVARSLGLLSDGAGRVGAPLTGASLIEEPPDPCALLPASALKPVGAAGVAPRRGDTYLLPKIGDARPQGCDWGDFDVSVLAVPESAQGGAEPAAARGYLGAHYYNRDLRGREDRPRERFFAALNGPGDQAFVFFESDGTADAELVFRLRNVLVGVNYTRYGGGDRNAMLDRVYTAAVAIAAALHG